jgi:hypothetical protein
MRLYKIILGRLVIEGGRAGQRERGETLCKIKSHRREKMERTVHKTQ